MHRGLVVAAPEIHDLHGLAAGALDEVVHCRGDDEIPGAGVVHSGQVGGSCIADSGIFTRDMLSGA